MKIRSQRVAFALAALLSALPSLAAASPGSVLHEQKICGNKLNFTVRSGQSGLMTTPSTTRFRQSLRLGDDCCTSTLVCTVVQEGGANKRMRCGSAP
jgi:hypothetical protein